MAGQLASIGFVVVLIGIALIIVGSVISATKSKTKTYFGFGGFIGPIPFGFANKKEILYLIIAVSVIMIIAFLVLGRKL